MHPFNWTRIIVISIILCGCAHHTTDRDCANARDAYIMGLHNILIKHFTYPNLARKNGQEGRVTLRFVIGDNNRAQDIEVIESSGFDLLDRTTVETIRNIQLPPPPCHSMQVPPITIVYRLAGAP